VEDSSSGGPDAFGDSPALRPPPPSPRVLVGGVGYRLLRDLSLGPLLMDRLQLEKWPEGVEIEDLSYGPVGVMHNLDARPPYDRIVLVGGVQRGRVPGAAFIDMGDQFIALMEGREQAADDERHFGLVVDDVAAVRAAVEREGLAVRHPGARGLDFLDPWGNHFQIVAYGAIQFERSPGVKRKLGIEELAKSESALHEIEERGLA